MVIFNCADCGTEWESKVNRKGPRYCAPCIEARRRLGTGPVQIKRGKNLNLSPQHVSHSPSSPEEKPSSELVPKNEESKIPRERPGKTTVSPEAAGGASGQASYPAAQKSDMPNSLTSAVEETQAISESDEPPLYPCPNCHTKSGGGVCHECETLLPWQKVPPELRRPARAISELKCPICKEATLETVTNKVLFVKMTHWRCGHCTSEFNRYHEGKLSLSPNTPLQEFREIREVYSGRRLEFWEWEDISLGGISWDQQKKRYEERTRFEKSELRQSLLNGELAWPTNWPSRVALKKGELAFCNWSSVTLSEPRSVRYSLYGGPSFRVASGVAIRIGGARSISHDEIKTIDAGTLTVTDKRLVFIGGKRTSQTDVKKLVSFEIYRDGLGVWTSSRQRPQFFNFKYDAYVMAGYMGRAYQLRINGRVLRHLLESFANQSLGKTLG